MSAQDATRTLACLGGTPAFDAVLPVGQLYFPSWERYTRAMTGIFDRGWYSNHGPLARELEERLASFFGVRHAMVVSNATVGLIMGLKCLGVEGKVLVPGFTFVATGQAVTWAGMEVRFGDVDPDTHQITAESAAAALDDDVRAVLAVNLWGGTCNPPAIETFARDHGLKLIFDSAHGAGVRTGGVLLGGFGDAEVFSFHATKVLSATEGGCVCTNDDQFAARLRNMRSSYGTGPPTPVPLTGNGRFSEAQAAIALMNLEDFEANRHHNHDIWSIYREALKEIPGLRLLVPAHTDHSNYSYAVVEVDETEYGVSRDALVDTLAAENVLARRYFSPGVHRTPPYVTEQRPSLPVTEMLSETLLQLPIGALVGEDDAAVIGRLLSRVHADSAAIRALAAG